MLFTGLNSTMHSLKNGKKGASPGFLGHCMAGSQLVLFCLFIVLVSYYVLDLKGYELRIPFNIESDAAIQLIYVKSIIDNGWSFSIPQLSAPFDMRGAAFPVANSVDGMIMKGIAVFSRSPGFVLNGYWLISLLLSGWSARYAMNLVGLRSFYASLGGVLYAFLPFAIFRNITHINLVYYTIPIISLFALWIIQPELIQEKHQRNFQRISLLACLIQGFNYLYFSFFGVALMLFAFACSDRKSEVRLSSLIRVSVLIIATGINLVPSFLSWHQDGMPPDMSYKYANEAEIYGAKFRKMIAPNARNPIPILANWGEKDQRGHFPNDDNESRTARLGLIASLGLLGSLAVSLSLYRSQILVMQNISKLSLFTFLMITVGGFGAVFNLLIVPDIRCYNRFSVFLSFLSLTWFFLWFSNLVWIKNRSIWATSSILVIFILSLYDQTMERDEILNKRTSIKSSYQLHQLAVTQLESEMTFPAKVLMMPFTDFPIDRGTHQMVMYAHAIPYLFSTKISWSWPSFSYQHKTWLDILRGLHGKQFLEYLALSGFDFIWLNRLGYSDGGDSIIEELHQAGGIPLPKGSIQPFEIIDLRTFRSNLIRQLGQNIYKRKQKMLLTAPVLGYEKGFYGVETDYDQTLYRWVMGDGQFRLFNPSNDLKKLQLSFSISKQSKGGQLTLEGPISKFTFEIPAEKMAITADFLVEPHAAILVNLHSTIPRFDAPNDSRNLHFAISDVSLRQLPMSEVPGQKNTGP